MSDQEQPSDRSDTLALSTTMEEDFISPLTELRSALEILHDFPDLDGQTRKEFVDKALRGCAHLQRSVEHLGRSIYEAGERNPVEDAEVAEHDAFDARITAHPETEILEMDLSDFVFDSSTKVNAFFDRVDDTVLISGHKWYFLVDFRNCSIWPEAWVAYAQRTKKIRLNYTHGTVRFAEGDEPPTDPAILASRAEAMARIKEMRAKRH